MPGRRLLDVLAFTPIVIPGLVLGLALSFVYLRVPLPIYGTLLILLISYCTRYLPYGMRYASTAMAQMSKELEESAMVSGASWAQTFRRVLVPLASSGILAGWVYILIVSFRALQKWPREDHDPPFAYAALWVSAAWGVSFLVLDWMGSGY